MDVPTRPSATAFIARPKPKNRRWRIRDVLRSLDGGPGYEGPKSDHFDGRLFFNLDPDVRSGRSFKDFLRWQRTRQRKLWPEWIENSARPALPTALETGQIALTFINHITFLLQFNGLNVLTDPVYSRRVSPFRRLGPRDRKSTRLNSSHLPTSRMPSSA